MQFSRFLIPLAVFLVGSSPVAAGAQPGEYAKCFDACRKRGGLVVDCGSWCKFNPPVTSCTPCLYGCTVDPSGAQVCDDPPGDDADPGDLEQPLPGDDSYNPNDGVCTSHEWGKWDREVVICTGSNGDWSCVEGDEVWECVSDDYDQGWSTDCPTCGTHLPRPPHGGEWHPPLVNPCPYDDADICGNLPAPPSFDCSPCLNGCTWDGVCSPLPGRG